MSDIRVFIAFDFSEDIYSALDRITIDLKKQLEGLPIRWVPIHNIHLTIKFLGNIPSNELDKLNNLLFEISNTIPSFKISLFGSGTFPSYQRPRVIWIGLKSPPALEEFQRQLEERTSSQGFQAEKRKFSPHITIGRVAKNAPKMEITEIGRRLENFKIGLIGTDCLSQVHIYQSDLKPDGPVYKKLYTASLFKANRN